MKPPSDDEEQNNHQTPDGDSTAKSELVHSNDPASTAVAATPNGTHVNGNVSNGHNHTQRLTALPVISVHHSENNAQPPSSEFNTQCNKEHTCHTLLEIIVKSASDPKQENDKGQGTGSASKTQAPNGAPDTSSKDKQKPEEASTTKVQSKRSLKRSRAAWNVMNFSKDLEKVFMSEFDSDSHSDSDSDFRRLSHSPYPDFRRPSRSSRPKKKDNASSWAESIVIDKKPEEVDDNSPSRLEWLRQKRDDKEENPYLDQLMSMVGLENVKAHFLSVKARVKATKSMSPVKEKLRLHMVLNGKDGTGKKTIAKLYAQFLFSIGAVSDEIFVRTSRALPKTTTLGKKRKGSSQPKPKDPTVVFYDKSSDNDARPSSFLSRYHPFYDSSSGSSDDSFFGRYNRSGSSDEIGNLVKMAGKSVLILSSRTKALIDSIERSEKALHEFQMPMTLPDYTEDELRKIMLRMMQKKGFSVEGGFEDRSLRALVKRVARERESKTFSNVHLLQEELDNACRRRALRLQREYTRWFGNGSTQDFQSSPLPNQHGQDPTDPGDQPKITNGTNGKEVVFTEEDLLGSEPKDARHDNTSWQKLQDMIGLDKVKRECGDIIDYAQINYQREILGMDPLKIGLNRVFLGPPGVGKTTVAQLYGQVLIDLGLVSRGKIMLRNPSHLIGAYIGHSEKMTKKVLEEARGNVLIIDDAHMLYPGATGAGHKTDVFRVAVLDTIVANVSADPEDRCIILVGYDHEMGQLFNNSNPGLQRRFPKETALRFDTYSEDELCQIMDFKAAKCGLEMTEDARAVSRQVLGRMRINPKFGNAGDVENLINQAKIRINARIRSPSSQGIGSVQVVLEPGDIDPHWDRDSRAEESRTALFEEFVGFRRIVKQFEGYQLLVDGMRLHNINPRHHVPWAFIFKGPPGTGKTSTARKVGRLYYDMGLLSTDEVVTCSVTDLVAEHVGQTGPKVLNTLETGLGKVLFIDEAYRLAMGATGTQANFHMEAIGELVDAMTQPRYKNNMVVILAGYTAEMEFLLKINPGLRSRFSEHLTFHPMTPHACYQHLKNEIQKLKISVWEEKDDEKMKKIYYLFESLSRTVGWASGRDVETLAKAIIGNMYMQQAKNKQEGIVESLYISLDGLIKAVEGMRRERKAQDKNNGSDK